MGTSNAPEPSVRVRVILSTYGLSGQLGTSDLVRASTPTKTSLDFVQIFSGSNSCFGVAPDGSIYSWGANTNYLLAKSNGSDSLTPVRVLDADMNWVYQEGDGDGVDQDTTTATPVPIPGTAGGEETEEPVLVSDPFVNGNGDGTFAPDANITRAEFLKMVVTALCDYDDTKDYGTSSFSDIPLNRWFENYVAYGELKGIINGYEGKFYPNDPITRAEATKIAAVAMGLDINGSPDAGFSDVSGWAVPYINAFAQTGAIQGDGDGTFRPQRNITRAEAAKIVAVAAGFQPEEDQIETLVSGVKNPFTDVREDKWYYVYILRASGLVK